MTLPDETEAGTAGTQPCRGIARWAHRDDEQCREDSFLRRPNPHRIEILHALKILARRAEYGTMQICAGLTSAAYLREHNCGECLADPTDRARHGLGG
jgi:hypothetical protein